MNRLVVDSRDVLGFLRVPGFQKLVSRPLQKLVHQAADAIFIFHQKDGWSGVFPASALRFRNLADPPKSADAREQDVETCALAHLTGGADVASGVYDDAVHNGQAQADTASRLFGGEERFEYARQRGFVHALAVIRHPYSHIPSRTV